MTDQPIALRDECPSCGRPVFDDRCLFCRNRQQVALEQAMAVLVHPTPARTCVLRARCPGRCRWPHAWWEDGLARICPGPQRIRDWLKGRRWVS